MVGSEDPVVERRLGPPSTRRFGLTLASSFGPRLSDGAISAGYSTRSSRKAAPPNRREFLRPQLLQFFLNALRAPSPGELRRPELSRRKIQRGKSHPVSNLCQRAEEIVFFRSQGRIGRRPRRHHPRHLPPHQFLRQSRIFHLLANRDLESLANQLSDISLGRVIRHAAHGNRHSFFLVAGGQCDLQLALMQPRHRQRKARRNPPVGRTSSAVGWSFLTAAYCRISGVDGSVILCGLRRIITKRACTLVRHFLCLSSKQTWKSGLTQTLAECFPSHPMELRKDPITRSWVITGDDPGDATPRFEGLAGYALILLSPQQVIAASPDAPGSAVVGTVCGPSPAALPHRRRSGTPRRRSLRSYVFSRGAEVISRKSQS